MWGLYNTRAYLAYSSQNSGVLRKRWCLSFSGRGKLNIMTWKDISSVFWQFNDTFLFAKENAEFWESVKETIRLLLQFRIFCFNCTSLYHFPSSLVILAPFFFFNLFPDWLKLFLSITFKPSLSETLFLTLSSVLVSFSSPSHPLFFLTEMNPSHLHTKLLSPLPLHTNYLFIDFYLSSHSSFQSFLAFRVNDTDRCSLHPFSKLSYTINSSCICPSTSHLPLFSYCFWHSHWHKTQQSHNTHTVYPFTPEPSQAVEGQVDS